MLTHPNKTLLKNRSFRIVFLIGVTTALISIILNAVSASSAGSYCVDRDYCRYHYTYYTNNCMEGSSLYCCSYSGGSDYYSCGSYRNSCRYVGGGYDYCDDGLLVGMYVCGGASLLCLIGMIVIASQHKKRVYREAMMANAQPYVPPAADNIIFSDRNGPNVYHDQNRVVIQPGQQPQNPYANYQNQPNQNGYPQR